MSSLKERIAAVRQEREKERTFVLPVRGYESIGLAARYRVLGYEELRDVGYQNEDLEGAEAELAVYADTLIRACVELLEKQPDGSYQALGCKWSSAGVRDTLGIDLPEGAGAREAVSAVFNGTGGGTDLALHFEAYETEATKAIEAIDEAVLGESEASSAPEEPSTSPSIQP